MTQFKCLTGQPQASYAAAGCVGNKTAELTTRIAEFGDRDGRRGRRTASTRCSNQGGRMVGRRVPLLQIKELLDAADIDKLRLPRWDGPFTVTVCLSNNAYRDTRASPCRARLG